MCADSSGFSIQGVLKNIGKISKGDNRNPNKHLSSKNTRDKTEIEKYSPYNHSLSL